MIERVSVKLVREESFYEGPEAHNAEEVVKLIAGKYCDMDREHMLILNFDCSMHLINYSVISIGTIDGTMCIPTDALKCAILSNAKDVILVHNHPSGNVHPSPTDIEMTARMKKAFDIFGIRIRDHIITNPTGMFYSMQEKGLIE